ncbi:DnaJ C-terminal domain-containing protein [Flavobacterium silvaticum]|uniref:J domain-containing protein n=1 Tax=Flavobacterium silvaticum TaxID=1852020 RepID=A0A972FUV9_9FLAO|nr:J domain-containing protein [Flavobacterium silvaticum]NMH28973.1 J domain-containing protein [Flavobacterium silvaticum]
MAFIDYYKTLGLNKDASADDIKKAYRKLARKLHPDLNPDDAEANKKFQQLSEAYEVLSNEENRKKYDAYGENWQHAEQYGQAGRNRQQATANDEGYTYSNFGQGDFSDFFESMFGGARGRGFGQAQYKGQDYTASIELNLRDILESHKQTLTVNGKNIRITIPAGVADGQVIKLKGFGAPGANSGPSGDLYITFHIKEDREFKRLGDDLYKNLEIDVYQAVLGSEITVETLSGKVKVKIAEGAQNGTKVKLKGKGMPVYKKEGTFGDLILTYSVAIPKNLSEKQKELFNQLSELK